ncbi:MAG TPA: hypothetical protein VF032_08405 [Thermoleophilaceae bacterium]
MSATVDVTDGAERQAAERAERPIFVAEHGRRARILKLVGLGLAAVTAVWLVALIGGATGVVRFPGLPLPSVGAMHDKGSSRAGDAAVPPARRAKPGASRPATAGARPATGRRLDPTRGPALTTSPGPSDPVSRRAPQRRSDAPRARVRPTPRAPRAPAASPAPGQSKTAPAPRGHGKPAYTPSGKTVPAGPGSSAGGSNKSHTRDGSGIAPAQGPELR